MLALIAMLLASPFPASAPACAWWSKAEHRCRDADMEIIGEWSPSKAPADWSSSYYGSGPPDFGAYPTEQRPGQLQSEP